MTENLSPVKKTQKISLHQKEAYRTKIINVSNEDELFHPVFKKARDILCFLMMETYYFHQNITSPQDYSDIYHYPNNMIAFCGSRGQGKTSAMLSFGKSLEQYSNQRAKETTPFFDVFPKEVQQTHFEVLRPIDPTILLPDDSVIKVVISRLFELFKKHEKENFSCFREGSQRQEGHLQELLGLFQTCFANINILSNGDSNITQGNDLDRLSELGDSSNFTKQFYQLIQSFLTYVSGDHHTSSTHFLVIQVDDADMNLGRAYQIMEELRKYCMIPNLIILLSTNLKQLSLAVEQHFLSQFKTLASQNPDHDSKNCYVLAQNYIDKILPSLRQIHLPRIDELIQNNHNECIELNYTCYDYLYNTQGKLCFSGEYETVLMEQIRRKTGILLLPTKGATHYFMPRTMRELCHFVDILKDLQDIFPNDMVDTLHDLLYGEVTSPEEQRKQEQLIECYKNNLDFFMDYFLTEWASIHLTQSQLKLIQRLHATEGYQKKAFVISEIPSYFEKKEHNVLSMQDIETEQWTQKYHTEFYTFADVNFVLERMKDFSFQEDGKYKFIYAIHFYFTLYCHTLLAQDLEVLASEKNIVEEISLDSELEEPITTHQEQQNKQPLQLLAFFNEAEFPWALLPEQQRTDIRFGGFPVDIPRIRCFLKQNNTENTSLETFLLSCIYKKRNRMQNKTLEIISVFDPLNASSLFYNQRLDEIKNLEGHDEGDRKDFLFCILCSSLNWDMQKRVIDELTQYQSNPSRSVSTSQLRDYDTSFISPLIQQRFYYETISNIYTTALGINDRSKHQLKQIKPTLFQYIYNSNAEFMKKYILNRTESAINTLSILSSATNPAPSKTISKILHYYFEDLKDFSVAYQGHFKDLYQGNGNKIPTLIKEAQSAHSKFSQYYPSWSLTDNIALKAIGYQCEIDTSYKQLGVQLQDKLKKLNIALTLEKKKK